MRFDFIVRIHNIIDERGNKQQKNKRKREIKKTLVLHLKYSEALRCRSMDKKKNLGNGKLRYMRSHLQHLTKLLDSYITVIY